MPDGGLVLGSPAGAHLSSTSKAWKKCRQEYWETPQVTFIQSRCKIFPHLGLRCGISTFPPGKAQPWDFLYCTLSLGGGPGSGPLCSCKPLPVSFINRQFLILLSLNTCSSAPECQEAVSTLVDPGTSLWVVP